MKLDTRHSTHETAFTLAELTIVVAIIALLVAIMVPALSKVHQRAKAAGTQAILSAISTGLETFKADGNVGGDYPPSYSDAEGSSPDDRGRVANPYRQGGASFDGGIKQMPGAGLLVWALAGADQLGTPGFKVFRTSGAKPSQFWSDDTVTTVDSGTTPDPTKCGAYGLNDDGRPVQPRSGPYLDMSKIQITPGEVNPDSGKLDFVVAAETKAYSGVKTFRRYPLFLDTFGFPVLYWKADPAGNRIADMRRSDAEAAGANRGIYHWEDNWALLDPQPMNRSDGIMPLALQEGDRDRAGDVAWQRVLHWDDDYYTSTYDADPATDAKPPPDMSFASFIMNPKVTAKLTPYRPDSYLLVSPGPDGEYGTADDVANFPIGRQQ